MESGTLIGETAWDECESAIRAFEDAWRTRGSARPDVGAFAPPAGPHSTRLLVELVHIDLEFRLRAGEDARSEDYFTRFPVLCAKETAVDLLVAEFALRNRYRPPAWPEEFLLRFPEYTAGLRARLPQEGRTGGTSSTRPTERGPAPLVGPPVIAGYDILDELGRGGMGVVYRARDRLLNRTVAVKTFATVPRAEGCARFAREAEAIARLDHPNIVPVYEVGEWSAAGHALPYFAMKLYAGGSLDDAPAGPGTDPKDHARTVAAIARAVHHAHQRGVLHRDLKPSNILLDDAGRPHVADFGLAGRVDPSDQTTLTAVVAGTPAYMAPEQASSPKQVSTAADVYGLGAVLFNRLTGRSPFAAETPLATMELVASAPAERPSARNPAVGRDLDTICLKCLEKDPARRYATAQDLADDLERWRNGLPISARPTPAWEHAYRRVRRHPVLSLLVVTTLAALVGAVAVLAESNARIREKEQEVRAAYLRECALRYKLEEALAREQRALYLERVASAGRLYQANQLTHAWAILDQCPEPLRGWEWRYLDALRKAPRAPAVRTLGARGPGANGLALAPDGKRVAVGPTAGDTGAVTFDTATGRELRRFPNCAGIGFHPTSGHTVTVKKDGTLTLWDSITGAELWSRSLPADGTKEIDPSALRIAFSSDGSRLALHDPRSGGVQLWNPTDGTPGGWLNTGASPVHGMAFSPNGSRLAVVAADAVTMWDVATRTQVPWDEGSRSATALAFSGEGRWIATADPERGVRVLDATNGQLVRTFVGNPGRVNALAFAPDGSRLVTGGADRTVRVWDVESGQELLALPGGENAVTAVAWDRGGSIYALAGAVRVWGSTRE